MLKRFSDFLSRLSKVSPPYSSTDFHEFWLRHCTDNSLSKYQLNTRQRPTTAWFCSVILKFIPVINSSLVYGEFKICQVKNGIFIRLLVHHFFFYSTVPVNIATDRRSSPSDIRVDSLPNTAGYRYLHNPTNCTAQSDHL